MLPARVVARGQRSEVTFSPKIISWSSRARRGSQISIRTKFELRSDLAYCAISGFDAFEPLDPGSCRIQRIVNRSPGYSENVNPRAKELSDRNFWRWWTPQGPVLTFWDFRLLSPETLLDPSKWTPKPCGARIAARLIWYLRGLRGLRLRLTNGPLRPARNAARLTLYFRDLRGRGVFNFVFSRPARMELME
ncbi:hypothetical protein L3X38_025148 [Prunus dulcis]|uniref:Uncharacterized protein n=1 Tax=Prunus dulcis TaxID=3755 RepID=A0AAD4W169_PRUDU|nr:hypothetical protein L3X38_025148 [Prunus dulcis]